MITPDRKRLREIQLTSLELLTEAHRICEKENIPYVIIAGTLLGSVRHGGFIPWDDDADIALLRSDYERFREACIRELDSSRFEFQDSGCTEGYRWGYGKIRRKGTSYVREDQEDMPFFQGIFMDVFPIDEIPSSSAGRKIWDLRCFIVRKFQWSRIGKKTAASPLQRALYTLMDKVPEERIRKWYLGLVKSSLKITAKKDTGDKKAPENKDASAAHTGRRCARILTFPAPRGKNAYYRDWYENRKKYVFEGAEFYGIRDADEYLTYKYGDYMKLPLENERRIHAVSRIVLLSDNVQEK